MVWVISLLLTNRSAAAGPQATSWLFSATPYLVAAVFLGGLGLAMVQRRTAPDRFATLTHLIEEEPLVE